MAILIIFTYFKNKAKSICPGPPKIFGGIENVSTKRTNENYGE